MKSLILITIISEEGFFQNKMFLVIFLELLKSTHYISDRPNVGNNGMSEQGRIFSRNNGKFCWKFIRTIFPIFGAFFDIFFHVVKMTVVQVVSLGFTNIDLYYIQQFWDQHSYFLIKCLINFLEIKFLVWVNIKSLKNV